jgi:hypothetical protein
VQDVWLDCTANLYAEVKQTLCTHGIRYVALIKSNVKYTTGFGSTSALEASQANAGMGAARGIGPKLAWHRYIAHYGTVNCVFAC